MRDLTSGARNAIAAERYRVAREGGSPTFRPPICCWRLRREPPRVERRFAEGRPRIAYDLYCLVVWMDLGLDPASKEARKMIDRVDKRLLKFR